jgi:hypothetical protein
MLFLWKWAKAFLLRKNLKLVKLNNNNYKHLISNSSNNNHNSNYYNKNSQTYSNKPKEINKICINNRKAKVKKKNWIVRIMKIIRIIMFKRKILIQNKKI